MRVFADLHHFDLYYSFQLLFEKRLGGQLSRPIGLDWLTEGYWKISDNPLVQKGYLGEGIDKDLQEWESFEGQESWARYALELLRVGETTEDSPGFWRVLDKSKNINQTGITLEAFKNTKFDIIISSLPYHFELFEILRQLYQPQAHHIFQTGNTWDLPDKCNLVMCSSIQKRDLKHIRYHQEFDLDVFSFRAQPITQDIFSYIHFSQSEELARKVFSFLPQLRFRFIGKTLGLKSEIIIKTNELAKLIQNSLFTWHIKPGGEGYGHILHNSFACGTPVITSLSDYKNTCGEDLLIDGRTCINIDNKSSLTIANEINYLLDNPSLYYQMRQNVFDRFREIVNFDKEFEDLKRFFEEL